MSEWIETEIGEFADLINGFAFKSDDFSASKLSDTFLPILKIKNVANGDANFNDVVYHEYSDKLHKFVISNNDILIALTGNHPIDKAQVVGGVSRYKHKEKALLNQRVGRIISKDKTKLDEDYLYYFFKWSNTQYYLGNQSSGSASQANISKNDVLSCPVSLPDIQLQKYIAKTLSSLDQKITLLRQQNQDLEELAQTLFKRWFVEFEFPNENGEPYKSSGGKMVESELGEIPEGWRVVQLQEVVEIGSSKRIFASEYLENGIPFYRGKEITELSNGKNLIPEIYISEERFEELKKISGAPKENDILLTSVGTIGNVYIVQKGEQFYFKDGNLTWFKNYKTYLNSTFIYIWLNSEYAKIAIEGIKIGSTQQAITISSLNTIEIVIPSELAYLKFENSLKNTISKRQTNTNEIQTLTQLRDTLLPKLMSGELRVNL